MSDYDYEKIFKDMEEEDNARRATSAITPEGGIPTVNFDGTPATAKAVIASPEPQKNLNEWDRLNGLERAWHAFWGGGVRSGLKSFAADDITEKKKAADEGLSALFGMDDIELPEEDMEKFRQAYADKTVGGEYKKQKERELEEAIGDYIDLSKKDKDYYAPTVVSAASKATEGKGFWESIPAWFAEVSKDPFDYALYIAGSSAGAIAPFLATSMAGGFALNAMKLNSVARAVQAATMGAGSYNVEFGSYIENYLAEKGYDLSNIESIKGALDKEDVNAIREKAFRRASVVGAFDAISAWIAPIRLNPSNALRTLRRGVAEGVQDVALPASRLHRVGKGLENMTLQTTLQGVMGGAGEAFGQLVNGEKINWGEVFAEAIGEFTTAPVEVVGLAYSANANFKRETAIARNAQEINKNLQDISNVVTAVAAKLPDNGSLQQWCEAVGKDKTLFAFAQDVIDSGAIDKLKEVAPALAQQVIEAAEKKSDVNVPVSDILKLSAKDEATARKLLNDVRLTADGMSPNQAEKFLKEGKKGIVEKFQKIVDDAKPDIELRKAIKVETDKIVNELVSTGTTKDVADLQVLPWASWLAVRAKQTGMKPSEIMEKVRLRIQGEQTNEGALNQSVSTALPSAAAVKSAIYPDPLFAHLWADYNEAKKNPKWFTTAIAKMSSIPGLEGATRGALNSDSSGEKIIQRLAENLVWLYKKVPKKLRQRSKLWYDGGRRAAEVWAQRYGLRPRQTAAIIAIFSPQTGWFANMSMAERLLDVYFSARRQKADQAMLDWFDTDQGKKYNRADVEGKSLEELIQANDFKRAAVWVRAYDKAHNSESRYTLSPEGGTLGIDQKPTGTGPAKTSYMTNRSIEAALSVIVDGSVDNIFKQIGSDFKVRDFYNNIFNPENPNAVTVDTHAVGAALFSVVSANDSVVADNFGNPGNMTSGQKGTYPIYFEAYRRAAKQLGILPRELQSITWEAIRALFDSSEKTKLRPQVEAIWKKADKGEITAEQARKKIFKLAGRFSKTAWEDAEFNSEITQTYDRSHVKLYDDIVQPEPEPVISLEAAPDPNDATAVAQWSKLKDSEKLAITQEVVPWVLNRVALETKTHIDEPSLQRGGYEGTPNYSMATTIEGGSDYVRVARLLATYLRQDSIMAISATPGAGMFPGKLIRIKLPEGYSTKQIDKLYNALDGIRDADGNRLIEGHSSVNGIMTIAVDASKLEEIKAGLNEVTGLKWKVDDSFIGFLKPYQTKENNNARNDTGRSSGIRQEVSAQYNDNLRRETAEMVARKIRERLEERRGSAQVRSSQDQPLTQPRPLFQRGYIGRSESVRASEARQEGQKPLSKWTKKAIIEAMKANGAPEELLRKAEAQPLWVLQQSVLSKTSWHHTGPNYQKTDFYGINDDYSDEKLGASWVSERIDEAAKAYSADYTEEAKKFAEFALSDFLAFDYYKEHQLGIFKKDRDFKRYTAYQKALESVEEEAHKRADEFHKRRDTKSLRPLTQRDVVRALEQLGYHGSPYQFDRFTLSHIGTGEGAQAHGWGLYFALNRQIAEAYRDRLADARTTYNGKSLHELHEELYKEFQAELTKPTSSDKLEKLHLLNSKMSLLTSFTIGGKGNVKVEKTAPKSTQDAYKWLTEEVYPNLKLEKDGKVYTAEIPDDDVMLREEKKISEQSEFIQNAVRKAIGDMKIKQDEEEVEDFLDGLENSDLGNMPKTIEKIQQMFSNNDERLSSDVSIVQALNDTVHQDAVDIYEWNKEDNDANDITVEEIESNCQNTLKEYLSEITRLARKNGDVDIGNLTGREVYSLLKDQFLSARSTSLYLNKFGIKGMRYNGSRDGECAVVWDEESIKILDALEQQAWHGSPYDNITQFTLDHIGEGEGAQAHGWGVYFALAIASAERYADLYSNYTTYWNGKRIDLDTTVELSAAERAVYTIMFERNLTEATGDQLRDIVAELRERIKRNKYARFFDLIDDGHSMSVKQQFQEIVDNADTTTVRLEKTPGQLPNGEPAKRTIYAVDIPDDDVMLREETAIATQSDKIRTAVAKLLAKYQTVKPSTLEKRKKAWLKNLDDFGGEASDAKRSIARIREIAQTEGPIAFRDFDSLFERIEADFNADMLDIAKGMIEDFNYAEGTTPEEIAGSEARFEVYSALEAECQSLYEAYQDANKPNIMNEVSEGSTGEQLYAALKEKLGSAKKASLLLNEYGIKGIRYNGDRDGECAVVWDTNAIRLKEQLEQGMQSGPRGTYMPQNTSDTNSMSGVMTLMQTRDKSTFLHESAHVWLDADTMLAKNIAEKVKSGQEITDGEKAFLKNLGGFFRWGQSEGVIDLGVTDDISTVADAVIRWSKMTTNDQRMMHELFAEGFEAYLMEGTAPNPEMRTVFGRFKKWLMDIYARATKQPRPISREVRKLYDLMFATQQQAQDTETRLGLQAMFKAADAKKLGMTDAEVQAYEELQEQATLETEGLVAKMVRGTMRIFGKARQDEIARIEKDKEAIAKKEDELLEEPRYRAVAMLNARQTVLDIRQMQGYDTDTIDALDAKGWISHDGGVSPDVLASMAGTTDAVGLIGDILDIDTVGDAHDEALRILAFEERKEFGDEGVFDELRANLAAYNDTRSRLLTAEYNAIARMLGNQQILRSAAREYAIEQIGNTKMSDLHPYTFVQAEQRCAREAEEALRKGDYAACLEAKRGQVLNHELARAALEAQERMDKGIRAVRRAMKSKTIHPQYKQLIAALVNAHAISNMTKAEREEFAKVEGMPPEKVTEFLAKLEENGTPVDGVAEFLQTHEHVQDMTAYTAEDFFGVVKQVATLGRNVLNQNLTDIAESVKEVVALGKQKLTEAADAQGRKVLTNQRSPMTRKERAFDSVAKFLLGNVKIQSWCRIFDRNKDGGFFWNLFIRSANEHANFEAEQRARCSQVLREKLLPAFKKSADEDPIAIPGFDRPFTHGMRLAVALNLGNESNKQRLITNDPRFTTEALQAIMDSLTEADWRAVEAVWQLFESFKTAIGEKELRVYGVEPEWIKYEPFKVTTKEGKTITVSGGYYPVKYDPVASNKVDKRTDAEAAEQDLRGAYQSATTRRSFTQSRVTGDVTDMPLRLDMSALYEGLNDVIHDLAWHEWLIDTKRVLDGAGGPDSGLRAAIRERYGYNVAKEFEEWRKDIALGGRSDGSSEALSFCLRNVGMATMGYSLTSAAVQFTGVGYVIPRTGVKAFTVALGKYLTSPLKTRRFVNSQSQAMLLRAQTQFKELAQIRSRLDQGKGFRAWIVDHAYSMMTFVQGIVDSVCWQAAYEKFSRQGYEGKELTALCDQTVIDTQSSGNISDMSRIERDKRGLARMMTMFYSWMNAALNMVVTTGMSEENKAKKIASLFWMCAVMPLIEQTFRDSLAAKGDGDDDDDDELAWMREDLGTIVEFNLGLLPVTREFSTAAESLVKGEPVFDYRGPAGLRLLSNVTGGIKTLANPDERKITRAITDLGGSLLGLPSVQINRTVKGVRAINSGQAEGFDAIKAPLFGFKGKVDD